MGRGIKVEYCLGFGMGILVAAYICRHFMSKWHKESVDLQLRGLELLKRAKGTIEHLEAENQRLKWKLESRRPH